MSKSETGQTKGPSKWSASARDLVKQRVRQLWVRAMQPHEIVVALCAPRPRQILNPITGEPYTPRTIYRLLKELGEDARQANAQKINEYMGKVVEAQWDLYRDAIIGKRKSEARRCLKDLTASLGGFLADVGAGEGVGLLKVVNVTVNAGPDPNSEENESSGGASEPSSD